MGTLPGARTSLPQCGVVLTRLLLMLASQLRSIESCQLVPVTVAGPKGAPSLRPEAPGVDPADSAEVRHQPEVRQGHGIMMLATRNPGHQNAACQWH
jgi:hypothetical protein